MNYIQVIQGCTFNSPAYGTHTFNVGDTVDPSSPWYYPLIWTGYAVDTGNPAPPGYQGPLTPLQYAGAPGDGQLAMWSAAKQQWVLVDSKNIGVPYVDTAAARPAAGVVAWLGATSTSTPANAQSGDLLFRPAN